ncbi:unnamed protein product [Rhizophagus irregularis]|uniref:Uncharacterized protein n=1 Tax=Rhizophagus irregularis TaxID=588596 RepID=A0A915YSN9_9GLOM|nr:unnamed protein product [Rhizophagus irregularis]
MEDNCHLPPYSLENKTNFLILKQNFLTDLTARKDKIEVGLLGDFNDQFGTMGSSHVINHQLLRFLHNQDFIDCFASDPLTDKPLPTHFYTHNNVPKSSRIDYIWLSRPIIYQ